MAKSLEALVRQAFPSPEWAVFFEVHDQTGFRARRRADAVALGVWPSRGHLIVGFEFKSDRRDWLREKKDPAKADVIVRHCDRWYVVAADAAIVKLDELPEPWGLLVASPTGEKLITKKPAVDYPDRDRLVMQRGFVASMLRKFTETTVPKATLDATVQERVALALENSHTGRELKYAQEHVEKLKQTIATFEKIAGFKITGWPGTSDIAAAVSAVLSLNGDRRTLENAAMALANAAKHINAALETWPVRKPVESD